jgi:hypothetical protein
MLHLHRTCLAVVFVFMAGLVLAADIDVEMAHGLISKADKETLVIQPRGAGGKLGKALTLKVTGTSRITTLVPQMRDGKTVLTQRDTDAKDLQPKQTVTVIYATVNKDEHVLLSAVVEPSSSK